MRIVSSGKHTWKIQTLLLLLLLDYYDQVLYERRKFAENRTWDHTIQHK